MNVCRVVAGLCLVFAAVSSSLGQDWLTAPSFYSHSNETGERTAQYAPDPVVAKPYDPTYLRSGYRQFQSTIRAGRSVDNYHIVEEWGRPVRPYGEWLHPYRPYSVPYQLWGAPYQGLGPTFNNNFGPNPFPYGNTPAGGFGPGGGVGPGYGPGGYGPGGGGGYGPNGGGYPGFQEGSI
ncbi:hypothetical protein LOC68_26475 [Blastopirellula sp. JC732]|uniref:Uncharacterized protein n=1 Tax=Blastopirellula sediminis TaxID=2894196 RepID=A0A9X1MTU0_9BACT|nr:hypothetical protein [Blastopirellula sediminis]MCC9604744.1 hypothetical protein [Blastopirellula sediminis]MCC9631957.1 hypothetical protein [Blastopirellula sediminis]